MAAIWYTKNHPFFSWAVMGKDPEQLVATVDLDNLKKMHVQVWDTRLARNVIDGECHYDILDEIFAHMQAENMSDFQAHLVQEMQIRALSETLHTSMCVGDIIVWDYKRAFMCQGIGWLPIPKPTNKGPAMLIGPP